MRVLSTTLLLCSGCLTFVPPEVFSLAETSSPAHSGTPEATWRSALYPDDWQPGFAVDDAFLHDFSWAGYRASEVPLPTALPEPIVDVLAFGADRTGTADATNAIQAALDSLPEGGTVHLPAGTYRIEGTLRITSDGIVIAGATQGDARLHFAGPNGFGGAGLLVAGEAAPEHPGWNLALDAEASSHQLTLHDASALSVGDEVALGWFITDAFLAEHGMTDVWTVSAGQWRPFFRRTVTALEGDRVTVDVPLRYPALIRDGASLRPDDGYVRDVGLQDLLVSSAASEAIAGADSQHHALHLRRVADAWVRNVRSFAPEGFTHHLRSGGILVEQSRRVTIEDTHLALAINRGSGGNGYLFELRQAGEVLIADSSARAGRHNFIQNWDFGTSGCVFLRTRSEEGAADHGSFTTVGASEFHHSLAMANLIDDSEVHDAWQAKNRHEQSSGAGHTATGTVFWNLRGTGALTSQQYDLGYVIGTGPELTVVTDPEAPDIFRGGDGTAPEDWSEGLGRADDLQPVSLYEDQLRRRLAR